MYTVIEAMNRRVTPVSIMSGQFSHWRTRITLLHTQPMHKSQDFQTQRFNVIILFVNTVLFTRTTFPGPHTLPLRSVCPGDTNYVFLKFSLLLKR